MTHYQQVQEFHDTFDPVTNKYPHALTSQEVQTRSHFIVEELVEYLSTISRDEADFACKVQQLKESINQAEQKVLNKGLPENDIVNQSDALIDLLYFIYGTFAIMGVDPNPLFDIVHQANMGKLFPDGKPHYDAVTGKVLKPDNWEKDYAPEGKLHQEIQRQQDKMKEDSCDERS